MKKTANPSLNFRIVLEAPPTGVDIGIQRGKGKAYQTEQIQRNKNPMVFEFSLSVTWADEQTPIFGGEWAQGSPKERFVYLDIGTYAGQQDSIWGRRLKILVSNLSAETTQTALNQSIGVVIRVAGTGKDGGPSCGTYKSLEGWRVMQG